MNDLDYIDNEEELNRRFESNELITKTPHHYIVKVSGVILIRSTTFLGRERPTLDRA